MDKQRQTERLLAIDDDRWPVIIDSLYGFVRYKAYDRGNGAFSEKSLAEPAVEHFVHEAISKLWNCVWEWREDLTIEEQLRLVIGSLMSEATRKYKQRGGKDNLTLNENLKIEDHSDNHSDFYEWLELVADGDEEMERYVRAFKICGSQAEIAVEMGVEVSKVYNITKRLKRKLESEKVLWIE
jgi:DNA-directed RNA polymerase specialized sigma24 family protein